MMLSRGHSSVLLISLVVLLFPQDAASRGHQPWSLPRTPIRASLMRHDITGFSSKPAAVWPTTTTTTTSMIVGLKGGETPPPPPNNQQQQQPQGNSASAVNLSETMARGGSTTTANRRTGLPKELQEAQVSFTSVANNGTMTSPEVTNSVATATAMTPVHAKKPKKEKFHKRVAKKLKNRNATNIRRKVMHASFGLFFASLNHFIPKNIFVPGMAVLSSATLVMELLRYRKHFGWMNKALHFVLGDALRKHEMDGKFTGSFYFFTGVTLTAALFPTSCASMGIIQLAIADPSASYFGRATRHVYWSRIENGLGGFGRNKGILGFLGGALFCVPFNYRLLSIAKFGAEGIPGGKASIALASVALGVAGAFADLAVPTPALTLPKKICGMKVPPLHLDDNFVVPVVSGFACTQVFRALGWQQNLDLAKFLFL